MMHPHNMPNPHRFTGLPNVAVFVEWTRARSVIAAARAWSSEVELAYAALDQCCAELELRDFVRWVGR